MSLVRIQTSTGAPVKVLGIVAGRSSDYDPRAPAAERAARGRAGGRRPGRPGKRAGLLNFRIKMKRSESLCEIDKPTGAAARARGGRRGGAGKRLEDLVGSTYGPLQRRIGLDVIHYAYLRRAERYGTREAIFKI